MSKLQERPYAEWLEDFLQKLEKEDPGQIALAYKAEDCVATGYFGCSAIDKAEIAAHIQFDSAFDMVLANADRIRDAIEDLDQEETEDG